MTGGIAPHLLNSTPDGGDAPAALPLGKEHLVPFLLEAGWAPEENGRYEVQKNLLPLPGIET
jgi:hypothetical protein